MDMLKLNKINDRGCNFVDKCLRLGNFNVFSIVSIKVIQLLISEFFFYYFLFLSQLMCIFKFLNDFLQLCL